MGVVAGPEKARGVLGALRGRIVDVLIADACLVHAILAADARHQRTPRTNAAASSPHTPTPATLSRTVAMGPAAV